MTNAIYTVLRGVYVSSYWWTVSRQPAQQVAAQCSLNYTGTNANAFSLWPLLFYLIIQNSVNLNLIAVCHGEAHWASVGEQLFLKHTAAGQLLFEVRDKAEAGEQLTWSQAAVYFVFVTAKRLLRHTGVWVEGRKLKPLFSAFHLWWITQDSRLWNWLLEVTITQLSKARLLAKTLSSKSVGVCSHLGVCMF